MDPIIPDYDGACVSNVAPVLLEQPPTPPDWLPDSAVAADRVVLLVLDGLGWEQLQERRHLAPTLAAMQGGAITTVAPSTTATALTSLALGLPPGDHGVVGYRINVRGEVLNVLRWSTPLGDARTRIPPGEFQPQEPFGGHRPPVVTRAEFATSGFSGAHLAGVRFHGWRVASTMVVEIRRLLRSGEPFVYAYYDGVDKVAHEYGLGEHYDAELQALDRLVADIVDVLPPRTALVLTSDHGQVDVGDEVRPLHQSVMAHVELLSGEGRFRWLHARTGEARRLHEAALAAHGAEAWVRTRDEVVAEEWFGPKLSSEAAERLGDVALVPFAPVAFLDPRDTGPYRLRSRHGSLTSAEMMVPLLAVLP